MAKDQRPPIQAGIPTMGPGGAMDMSQASQADVAREREQMRRNGSHGGNEEDDERLSARDDTFEASRGGGHRPMSPEEWDRARAPTDPERRRLIREVMAQSILPDLPRAPGWRRCWVSTNHPNDTPHRRQLLGYRFVKADALRTESFAIGEMTVKDGEMQGNVMCREMVAMECPEELYNELMREFHHDQPMELAREIYEGLASAGEEVAGRGGRTTMEPGTAALAAHHLPPRQFE